MWNGNPTNIVIFAQDCFGYLASFTVSYVFGIIFLFCEKKCCACFGWNCIVSVNLILVGQYFIISVLPIHEHGRSFHFLVSSSISFFRDLKLYSQRSFSPLVRFIPRYCGWECKLEQPFQKSVWRLLKKLKINLSHDCTGTHTLWLVPKALSILLHRYLLNSVHFCFIHNSWEMETT